MFDDLVSLKILSLEKNEIYEIDMACFGRLANLLTLKLSENGLNPRAVRVRLSSVSKSLTLPSLVDLYLKNSSSLILDAFNFTGLKRVDLSFCSLSQETVERIPFESLELLNLNGVSWNSASPIVSHLEQNSRLKELELTGNRLEYGPGFLQNSVHIKALWLGGTGMNLTSMKSMDFMRRFQDMTFLNLSHNNLEDFTLKSFKLTSLDISFNLLRSIRAEQFAGLTHLSSLILSHNNLTFLEDYSLSSQPNLEYLDLSFNNLESIGPEFFGTNDLGYLNTFYLNNNQLKNVSYFSSSPIIMHFDLTSNNLDTIPSSVLDNAVYVFTL